MFVGDPALAINEKRLGYAVNAIIYGDPTLGIATVWVSNRELLDETFGSLLSILDVHPQEDDLPVFDLAPRLFQQACLGAAGWAPGGPEVEEDDLSAEVRETDGASVKERKGEIGGLLSREDRRNRSRIRGEAVGEQTDYREDPAEREDIPSNRPSLPLLAEVSGQFFAIRSL